jgi:hypothetical protein
MRKESGSIAWVICYYRGSSSLCRTCGPPDGEEEDETMDFGKTMELAARDKSYEKKLDDMIKGEDQTTINDADIVSLVSKRDT